MLKSQPQNNAFIFPERKTRVAFHHPEAGEALMKIKSQRPAHWQRGSSSSLVSLNGCLAAKNNACPCSCVFSRHSLTGNPKINHFGFGFCFSVLRFFSSPHLHPLAKARHTCCGLGWDLSGWRGSVRTQKLRKTEQCAFMAPADSSLAFHTP